MNLRNVISQLAEGDYTILGICEVSSWSRIFFTIPEKHVQTYLITHPFIYKEYAPADPKRIIGLKLYNALINADSNTLKKYGVKYILIELPNKSQWYHPEVRELAYNLWSKDFSYIATLIYSYYDNRTGYGLKLWRLKSEPNLKLKA